MQQHQSVIYVFSSNLQTKIFYLVQFSEINYVQHNDKIYSYNILIFLLLIILYRVSDDLHVIHLQNTNIQRKLTNSCAMSK